MAQPCREELERTLPSGKTSAVHFLRFVLDAAQRWAVVLFPFFPFFFVLYVLLILLSPPQARLPQRVVRVRRRGPRGLHALDGARTQAARGNFSRFGLKRANGKNKPFCIYFIITLLLALYHLDSPHNTNASADTSNGSDQWKVEAALVATGADEGDADASVENVT